MADIPRLTTPIKAIATGLVFLLTLSIFVGYAAPQVNFLSTVSAQPATNNLSASQPQEQFLPPIPGWIKNNSALWVQGKITDQQFILGIRYLVANNYIPVFSQYNWSGPAKPIPSWFKNPAGWWAEGIVSDYDFTESLQYLLDNNVIMLTGSGTETSLQDTAILKKNFPTGRIQVGNVTLDVQVADTPDRMTEGLQFQQPLPYTQGMIFVFSEPQPVAMWMKDMQFPLDMIWFDSSGNVIHLEKNLPPCDPALPCQVYDSGNQNTKYVLEVTAGFVDKFHITGNSRLTIMKNP